MHNIRLVSAIVKTTKTELVDDLIDFANGTTSKNPQHYLSCSIYGSTSGEVLTASGSGSLAITRKGEIELTIAPAIGSTSSTFNFNSGNDQDKKNISDVQTLKISTADMIENNGLYSISFSMSNIILLKAKFIGKSELVYPTVSDSRRIDWSKPSILKHDYIGLNGGNNNYSSEDGYHQLRTSGSYIAYPLGYCGDSTLTFNAKSPFVQGITMPEYTNNDQNMLVTGVIRLFSPIKRSSANKYCELKPYSTDYDGKANLISTDFTIPINTVLNKSGYQGENTLPSAALTKLTSAACSKLKNDYGDNIRIYVIKYRKQEKYKTFPLHGVNRTDADHRYEYIDNCASDGYIYNVTNETGLKETLNSIATNIKSFAGYQNAKNVE